MILSKSEFNLTDRLAVLEYLRDVLINGSEAEKSLAQLSFLQDLAIRCKGIGLSNAGGLNKGIRASYAQLGVAENNSTEIVDLMAQEVLTLRQRFIEDEIYIADVLGPPNRPSQSQIYLQQVTGGDTIFVIPAGDAVPVGTVAEILNFSAASHWHCVALLLKPSQSVNVTRKHCDAIVALAFDGDGFIVATRE